MRSARSAMVALCLGGCSIALGGPDAARVARVRPTCDTSKSLVKLDGGTATGLGVLGLGLLSSSGAAASVFLVTGALYAAAALRGNHVVDRCREDFEQFDREVAVAPSPPPSPLPSPSPRPSAQTPPQSPAAPPAVRVATPRAIARPSAPSADDSFHVAVGEGSPSTTAPTPTSTPAPPTTSPWRDFWREVP